MTSNRSDAERPIDTMLHNVRRIRYRAIRTRLRAPLAWLLHRRLTSNDVFIGSYPRSGSHWLKFQLLEILTSQLASFENIKQLIPKVGDHGIPGAAALEALGLILPAEAPSIVPGRGRLIHTHERYRPEYKKAIYLVRDLRDVALSEYAQAKTLNILRYYDLTDFDSFLEPFLNGKIDRYGPWQDHVASWLESSLAKNGSLLVIRFEDLRRNTQKLLISVVQFLGIRVDEDVIRRAIVNNTVDRMREKEDVSKVLVRGPGEDGRFVRRGSVGGWRERLTDAQLERIERYAGATLARMGYPRIDSGTQKIIPRGEAYASAG
jgi:hypothetical protein